MRKTINISVRSSESRYVALDLKKQDQVIAEGKTASGVAKKAQKTGRLFSMMFIPERGRTYVF